MLPETDALGGRLLSADELAARLGQTRRWVYRMHDEHGLPAIQLGRKLLFRETAAAAWLASKESDGHVDNDGPREEIE